MTALSVILAVPAFAQTTINYTGGVQYYVVPSNTYSLFLDVRGAQGGTAGNLTQMPQIANGGLGGRVQGSVNVTPGDTIWIYVGGSSFTDNSVVSVIHTQGFQQGHGQVIIQEVTGLNGYDEGVSFVLYPNPADALVSVYMGSYNGNHGVVKVYDVTGKLMLETEWKGEAILSIPTGQLVPGLYSVSLVTSEGAATRNLIIR